MVDFGSRCSCREGSRSWVRMVDREAGSVSYCQLVQAQLTLNGARLGSEANGANLSSRLSDPCAE